jgi:hypothetical protein
MVQEQSPRGSRGYRKRYPGGDALKAIGALIESSTESEEEKEEARMLLIELENADRANARQREVEVTKVTGKRDWMQALVGMAAMTIGVVMVIWAMTGIQDKEVFFHILGFAEGTLVGQVVNYYFGSAKS